MPNNIMKWLSNGGHKLDYVSDVYDVSKFELLAATYKQDDRVYIRLINGSETDGLPQIWRYFVRRPLGVAGVDYEVAIDAEEGFNIVQRRNKILRRQYANTNTDTETKFETKGETEAVATSAA